MKTPRLLQPLLILQATFTDINMGFIEGFFKSKGKEVVIVVVDKFSKYVHFIALHHPYKTTSMAKSFMDNVFKIYGFLPQL
jgi:hypothetical protein